VTAALAIAFALPRSCEGRPRVTEEPTIARLVRAARGGDRDAFTTIYERFHGAVHAVLLSKVRWMDCADLVQDVFLTAWQRLPSVRDPDAFPGWLMAIARNRAVDHLRKPRPVEGVEEPSVDPVPTADARRVLVAIRALPEAYREVMLMRLVEGMGGPEIAASTGLTPGSVRVNLHRGMKLLREQLGIVVTADGDDT